MSAKNKQQERNEEMVLSSRIALSMDEFADCYGISKSTAYELVRDNLLKTFVIGRRRFVSVEEAKALAARLTGMNVNSQMA